MPRQSLYREIERHLQSDPLPSDYLNEQSRKPVFRDYPFDMLHKLKDTEQSARHHPEGSVWNHTMLVVDQAAKMRADSKEPVAFMWAALLHDIGKPATTKAQKGRVTAYGHDQVGARLTQAFLSEFTKDRGFIHRVSMLVRYHMHILYVLKDLPFSDLAGLGRDTDLDEVALLGLCDRLGRSKGDRQAERDSVRLFLRKCNQIKKENDHAS